MACILRRRGFEGDSLSKIRISHIWPRSYLLPECMGSTLPSYFHKMQSDIDIGLIFGFYIIGSVIFHIPKMLA